MMSHLTQMEYTIELLAEDNEFSGVIGVFCDGERVYKKAHGYADRSNARDNTVSTRFGIASGTKFFTALAIGQLIEQGKLITRSSDRS
ncbi:MAG: serine hydrolase [Vallitaleaceae bacterium]|nr:serine hydrolase [Vallitaleaceae bacterium]